MPPPYQSEEIAAAVADRLQAHGIAWTRLTVDANDHTQAWTIRVQPRDEATRSLSLPFADVEGITTPADAADAVEGLFRNTPTPE